MGAASHWPSSRTGNDNRLRGSTEGKRLLVSSAFDLEFWDKFNSIQFNSIVRCQPFCHWLHVCLLAVDCSPSTQTLLLPEKSSGFGFCFRISTKLWRVVVKGAGWSHPRWSQGTLMFGMPWGTTLCDTLADFFIFGVKEKNLKRKMILSPHSVSLPKAPPPPLPISLGDIWLHKVPSTLGWLFEVHNFQVQAL
jgi:hypothetical protein